MSRPISFEDAKRVYINRYTVEHVPAWARVGCDGRHYAPQYASDLEWYENTQFPGEGDIGKRETHCYSANPSWPLGTWLVKPYKRGGANPPAPERRYQIVERPKGEEKYKFVAHGARYSEADAKAFEDRAKVRGDSVVLILL